MKTAYKRPSSFQIPGYSSNAVLQLIIASGVGYVALFFTVVCFQAFAHLQYQEGLEKVMSWIALPQVQNYPSKWWTLLTFGWSHEGFWEWATNMLWLYCFGSILQTLVGYKQIIPLFFFSLVVGGITYLLCQFIPDRNFIGRLHLLGAQAGIMGLAAAVITIAPNYKMYLGPTLGIHILIVAGVFFVLMLVNYNFNPLMIALLLGGALSGFIYARALQVGYRPGEWIYTSLSRLETVFTPDEKAAIEKHNKRRSQVLSRMYEPKQGISQKRIDEILDKILQNGYGSLSKDEKETLLRASKENES